MPERLEDAFFRSLFETDIAGIAVADLGTETVIEANERLLEILGKTREQIVGVPGLWLAITPPEYHPLDLAALQSVQSGRRSEPFEKEYIRDDGSRVPVRVTVSLVQNHPDKFVLVISDLSAERRRELEIRNTNTQLQQLADSLPALVSFVDRDLRYRFVNRPYEEWFGRPRHEIIGRSIKNFLREEDLAARLEAIEAVLRGAPQTLEAQALSADGVLRSTEMKYVPQFDASGLVEGFYVLASDITERKRIEEELRRSLEALRESEARFRAMAEAAPIMIWQRGPGGESEYLNKAYLDFFGKDPAKALGFGWEPVEHPDDDTEANLAEYRAAVQEQRPFEIEARLLRADGRYRILQSVGVPRRDADGRYLGHVGISRDITDERDFQAQQKLLIDELNHRVKNTLAVVQSIAWQTLRDQDVPPALRRSFEQRLMALATAHDVLTRKNWNPASVEVIIRTGIEALSIPEDRVSVSGPLFRVPPKTAVSLAMAVHELATNALKYGSLSSTTGAVSVSWRVNGGGFELTWAEQGGAGIASTPAREGFGTRLLKRGLAAELGGEVTLDYLPNGLVCTISAPVPAGAYVIV